MGVTGYGNLSRGCFTSQICNGYTDFFHCTIDRGDTYDKKLRKEILAEIKTLANTNPDEMPAEEKFSWNLTMTNFAE